MSFMLLNEHLETNYYQWFSKKSKIDMMKNQKLFYKLCKESMNCPQEILMETYKNDYVQSAWNQIDESYAFRVIDARAAVKLGTE